MPPITVNSHQLPCRNDNARATVMGAAIAKQKTA